MIKEINSESPRSAVVTLFEGDYVQGVGALANSLINSGYSGTLYCGYRGPLLRWACSADLVSDHRRYKATENFDIVFIALDSDWHLTNLKTAFMLQVMEQYAPDIDYVFYFDPDIIVKVSWPFFEQWSNYGVALVADSTYPLMPPDHPLRHRWLEFAQSLGYSLQRSLCFHYNGGFLGVKRVFKSFLSINAAMQDALPLQGVDMKAFMPGTRADVFGATDQDTFNITAMVSPTPISTMGQDAMDFAVGGYVMSHIFGPKPWRGSVLRRAFNGYPPSLAVKQFAKYVNDPIPVFSRNRAIVFRWEVKVASLIGRFYRRT